MQEKHCAEHYWDTETVPVGLKNLTLELAEKGPL